LRGQCQLEKRWACCYRESMVSGGGPISRWPAIASANGRFILTPAATTVKVYSAVSGALTAVLTGHVAEVTAAVLAPNTESQARPWCRGRRGPQRYCARQCWQLLCRLSLLHSQAKKLHGRARSESYTPPSVTVSARSELPTPSSDCVPLSNSSSFGAWPGKGAVHGGNPPRKHRPLSRCRCGPRRWMARCACGTSWRAPSCSVSTWATPSTAWCAPGPPALGRRHGAALFAAVCAPHASRRHGICRRRRPAARRRPALRPCRRPLHAVQSTGCDPARRAARTRTAPSGPGPGPTRRAAAGPERQRRQRGRVRAQVLALARLRRQRSERTPT